jgi:hypothetical protein
VATKKWTDEEVQAEIQAAVKIVAEDREKAEYARLHERYGKAPEGDGGSGSSGDGDGSKAPPKKEGEPEPNLDGGKKRSLWWGEVNDE